MQRVASQRLRRRQPHYVSYVVYPTKVRGMKIKQRTTTAAAWIAVGAHAVGTVAILSAVSMSVVN